MKVVSSQKFEFDDGAITKMHEHLSEIKSVDIFH